MNRQQGHDLVSSRGGFVSELRRGLCLCEAAFQISVFCLAGVTQLFVSVPLFAAASAAPAIDLIYLPFALTGN
jgi:hypothetical protein